MKKYLRHEGLLARWAYLLDNLLELGNPQSVPFWEFWLRSTVFVPGLIFVAGGILWKLGRALWYTPGKVLMGLFFVWLACLIVGAVFKLNDYMNQKEDLRRDWIFFE